MNIMRHLILVLISLCFLSFSAMAQDYKIVTTIESVVPGGLGRSKMLITDARGTKQFDNLKNFFSLTGIKFENIENNDQEILKALADLEAEGYRFLSVNSGVYSSEGSTGLFVTRFIYRKESN